MNVPSAVRSLQFASQKRSCLLLQKRFKYKKKWAVNLPTKTHCELALEHFDGFYRPLFGAQWPYVRVALLSLQKYAAVVNNASDSEATVENLSELGAHDLIQEAARVALSKGLYGAQRSQEGRDTGTEEGSAVENEARPQTSTHITSELNANQSADITNEGKQTQPTSSQDSHFAASDKPTNDADSGGKSQLRMKNMLPPVHDPSDLEHFMPTEQVYSEKEELLREEYSVSTFQEHPISVPVIPGQLPAFPPSLKVMAFPRGDVTDFASPATHNGNYLNYYLLDASSILPVIALDLRPQDSVLDLCAAPGGKSLAMLQIIISQGGHLVSNDNSPSRLNRLRKVIRSYLPDDLQDEFVTVVERHGLTYSEPRYSKVLVDVPCNSDRHVLSSEDNNLFKPGRIKERLQLTTLQKDLLIAGIKSCKPGGSIVYSTCTLTAVQNDGIVQRAVEELWETSDVDVSVEDLSAMREAFSPSFRFHTRTRLGQLVLPSLVNNFGPMYFCKLKRLK